MNTKNPTKWVGLAEVSQRDGVDILGTDRSAHVTVLAWCKDETEFLSVVAAALDEHGLDLRVAKEVETCEKRMLTNSVPAKFVTAFNEVKAENAVVFMEFHTFPV